MNIVKTFIGILFFLSFWAKSQCPPDSDVLLTPTGFIPSVCFDNPGVDLNEFINSTFAGGTFSGPGVTGDLYIAADGLVGSLGTITYDVTIGADNCQYILNYFLVDTQIPVLTLNETIESSYCETDPIVPLTGTSTLGTVGVEVNGESLTVPVYDPAEHVGNLDTIVFFYGLNCVKYDTFYVEVYAMPTINVPASLQTNDEPIAIIVNQEGGVFDIPAGLSVSGNIIDPSTSVPGIYEISYELSPNCFTTASIEIIEFVEPPEPPGPEPEVNEEVLVFVANVFTPNNDNVNDELKVQGRNIINAYIKIFNRWGEKVFESDDINVGWDGSYKDAEQPSGVYYYYVTAAMNDSTYIYKEGDITLIR